MARLLVCGPRRSLADRLLLERLLARIRGDGHEADALGQDIQKEVRDADALVALLDAPDAATVAGVAHAQANRRPVLGLHGRDAELPQWLAGALATRHAADSEADLLEALPAFYEKVRPFAGRLVRDRIPKLVEEAGHDVRFRELGADEKPRFLKQKVAEEARALAAADVGDEKEEIADLLEALEALIRARGIGRDALKAVKDGKHKRRGGFERGFVVEATSRGGPASSASGDAAGRKAPEPGAQRRRADGAAALPRPDRHAAQPGQGGKRHEPPGRHGSEPTKRDPKSVEREDAPARRAPADGPPPQARETPRGGPRRPGEGEIEFEFSDAAPAPAKPQTPDSADDASTGKDEGDERLAARGEGATHARRDGPAAPPAGPPEAERADGGPPAAGGPAHGPGPAEPEGGAEADEDGPGTGETGVDDVGTAKDRRVEPTFFEL